MGFSRQEYWSGLPWLPPGDLPNPRFEPVSFTFPALVGVVVVVVVVLPLALPIENSMGVAHKTKNRTTI